MPRYFIKVSYKGTRYSGFQVQQNANSIQAEVEKALKVYYKEAFKLTGSSRTDAGVHAAQNFFHFDSEQLIEDQSYHLNALLPPDIVIKEIFVVQPDSHCRFDAISREYRYYLYQQKDPFREDRAYFFPFKLDLGLLNEAAGQLLQVKDFTTFSKRNTQVKTPICNITRSEWAQDDDVFTYSVTSNRFLRGMVRGMVGTMLQAGRSKISLQQFINIIQSKDCTKADFSVPAHGLFLQKVNFPDF